jgi:hypothetical protein
MKVKLNFWNDGPAMKRNCELGKNAKQGKMFLLIKETN